MSKVRAEAKVPNTSPVDGGGTWEHMFRNALIFGSLSQ